MCVHTHKQSKISIYFKNKTACNPRWMDILETWAPDHTVLTSIDGCVDRT